MSDLDEDTLIYTSAQSFADMFFAPAETGVSISFGAASHTGNLRSRNEDHYAVLRSRRSTETVLSSLAAEVLAVPESCSHSMIVVDGMGGMNSGELASRLALQTMLELSGQATSWVMKLTDLDAQQIHERVAAYVQRIHATLQAHSESHSSSKDMGTTWTSAHLLGDHAVIAHLGDSRAYLFRDWQLVQITRDDTMAQELVDRGMDPEDVRSLNHILVNSFGGGNEYASASIYDLEIHAGDKLLLCTDGLTDMVPEQVIASELAHPSSSAQSICDALIGHALAKGGKDNVTVVLASVKSAME